MVQPGVEFNHDSVVDYDSEGAVNLTEFSMKKRVWSMRRTRRTTSGPRHIANLVRDGFAILKVGPALTFAMREVLAALSTIETELVEPAQCSRLMDVLERVMLQDPRHWEHHYTGDEHAMHLMRRYSYSDRVRYYWNAPPAKEAVEKLLLNLRQVTIPETMLSAYLPEEYLAVRAGTLHSDANSLVIHRIRTVLRAYAEACSA